MRCPSCNAENQPNAKFCVECGTAFQTPCWRCGFNNPPTAKFCQECGGSLKPGSGSQPQVAAQPASLDKATVAERPLVESHNVPEGERKTITALFADIRGSTELMADLDPEEARAIIDPALRIMVDAVRRYEGYVVQSTGDGIFALFGAPVAHEDHPQRALYAALRIQEEMRRYSSKLREAGDLPVEARVGVNTGEVVVRSISISRGHTEYTPIGHTANLASRMQALAPTGSIAVSEATHRLCQGYFILQPLGPTRVKGLSDPVNIYEVTGLGPLRTRLQRAVGHGLTKFVGRQHEMEALKHALEQARAGHGQIVAAMAEPGVGKSRLFFEFKAISQSGCMVLETFSVSHGKASAYLPVIDLLHGYFKITGEDDERTRREKVAGKITILDRALEDTLPFQFSVLGIVEGDDPLAQMDGQVKKRRTLEAIKRILLRESINQPLMVIFEDLHWIDEQTQEFLNLLADSIGTAKILLMVNYRPEYSHQWGSKPYYTQLRLDPLGRESAEEMLSSLLGAGDELTPLKRLIIEKTEGTPFFIEETVQVLLDEGALVRNGAMHLRKPLAELKIPPTVQAILAARIDRLASDAKDLLQTLAVIGREFPLSLIRAVVTKSDDELNRMLNDLQLGEFIYEQPAVGDPEYVFKHALTQEVAHNSVLVERRKQLHERIAVAIEKLFPNKLDDHFAELAHHYGRSRNLAKAIDYAWLAANQASQRSAYSEAIGYVNHALELLTGMPESDERARHELKLQITLGGAFMATKGFSSVEVERAFSRARDLARKLDDTFQLFAVLQGAWGFSYSRRDTDGARRIAEESMALAERAADPGMLNDAYRAMGCSLELAGELTAARTYLEKALAQRAAPRYETIRFGPDTHVLCLNRLSDVLFQMGFPDQALKRSYEAIDFIKGRSDPFSLAMAMVGAAQAHCGRREAVEGEQLSRSLIAMCSERGYPFWLTVGKRMLNWALVMQGRFEEAIALIREHLNESTGTDAETARYYALPTLAQAYSGGGDVKSALAALDEWLAVRNVGTLSGMDPYCYRLRGELLLKAGSDGEAAWALRRAIDLATNWGARIEQLRATTVLARLLDKQGRRGEARTMLAEIYGWFTEGFDTADLKDAKALLEELNG
jgi:class 3 adenylate cyclase/tetratricopeptide (TPR) repeat protein